MNEIIDGLTMYFGCQKPGGRPLSEAGLAKWKAKGGEVCDGVPLKSGPNKGKSPGKYRLLKEGSKAHTAREKRYSKLKELRKKAREAKQKSGGLTKKEKPIKQEKKQAEKEKIDQAKDQAKDQEKPQVKDPKKMTDKELFRFVLSLVPKEKQGSIKTGMDAVDAAVYKMSDNIKSSAVNELIDRGLAQEEINPIQNRIFEAKKIYDSADGERKEAFGNLVEKFEKFTEYEHAGTISDEQKTQAIRDIGEMAKAAGVFPGESSVGIVGNNAKDVVEFATAIFDSQIKIEKIAKNNPVFAAEYESVYKNAPLGAYVLGKDVFADSIDVKEFGADNWNGVCRNNTERMGEESKKQVPAGVTGNIIEQRRGGAETMLHEVAHVVETAISAASPYVKNAFISFTGHFWGENEFNPTASRDVMKWKRSNEAVDVNLPSNLLNVKKEGANFPREYAEKNLRETWACMAQEVTSRLAAGLEPRKEDKSFMAVFSALAREQAGKK